MWAPRQERRRRPDLAAPALAAGRSGGRIGSNAILTRSVIGLESVRTMSLRAVRVSEDILPVSEFKAQAAACFRRIAQTGQPIVITQNGKAAGVLLSPGEFDRLSEQARFVAAVQEGLADADAGELRDHAEVVERMRARRRDR